VRIGGDRRGYRHCGTWERRHPCLHQAACGLFIPLALALLRAFSSDYRECEQKALLIGGVATVNASEFAVDGVVCLQRNFSPPEMDTRASHQKCNFNPVDCRGSDAPRHCLAMTVAAPSYRYVLSTRSPPSLRNLGAPASLPASGGTVLQRVAVSCRFHHCCATRVILKELRGEKYSVGNLTKKGFVIAKAT
jgi:hypothetical protein